MPNYDEKENQFTFPAEESTENVCPICGYVGLEYGTSESFDGGIIYPWSCPKCGSEGKEYGAISFDGHNVDALTMPVDKQVEFLGARTLCINRALVAGDLVLASPDNGFLPCLPGRIKAIDMLGSTAHTSGNQTDDVHVDFRGDYGERRRREIVEADARLRGQEIPFDEICLDDVIMAPSDLIGISEITEQELCRVMESEENALRHAYKCLRMLL